ncbi:TetR/AcrR family transcriptional regulator [Acidaminobacter sp. JC074]|uniref:TetR/AcrR family transcriptional regulator n=1 Tax=Acidaminobacter sp. JC074 TaxID=2530199 RepID=UPI001F0D7332|nr:TetR/AcrR family transcriptional regulator [Acidaminobacter sp. JC074]MCH4889594.1 TetR/AcrR family transcriptional regulator [Acidaminobacter sp. JC074]
MNTKDKILLVSYDYYTKYGEFFSLSQIAEELGIKKQSIYSHFKNKDELLRTMLYQAVGNYLLQINQEFEAAKDLPIKNRLYKMGIKFIEFNADEKNFKTRKWLAISKENFPFIDDMLSQSSHELDLLMDTVFEDGIKNNQLKDLPPQTMRKTYIYMIRGIIDNIMPSKLDENLDIFEEVFEFFYASIEK